MKRSFVKHPTTVAASTDASGQFGIGVFDREDNLIGWLSGFSQSRGSALVRCRRDSSRAKLYPSLSSAKRAIGYYKYFNEIYVYEDGKSGPAVHYAMWRSDVDLDELSVRGGVECKDVAGCYLKALDVAQ